MWAEGSCVYYFAIDIVYIEHFYMWFSLNLIVVIKSGYYQRYFCHFWRMSFISVSSRIVLTSNINFLPLWWEHLTFVLTKVEYPQLQILSNTIFTFKLRSVIWVGVLLQIGSSLLQSIPGNVWLINVVVGSIPLCRHINRTFSFINSTIG